MKLKKGITLVSLVVTIIILLLLVGITVGFLSDESALTQVQGSKKDAIEKNIKEYVTSNYLQIVTNPDFEENYVEELGNMIDQDNAVKSPEEQFEVKFIDQDNKKIVIKHQNVEFEVDLLDIEEGNLGGQDESVKNKLHSVVFNYRDENDEDKFKKVTIYIKDNMTIRNYLDTANESLPDKDWAPVLEMDTPVTASKVYTELGTGYTHRYTVRFDLNGGSIDGNTSISDEMVRVNEIATDPGVPLKMHYIFNGWTSDITSPIINDTLFIAQWTPVDYTFTYNLNNGNIGGSSSDVFISGAYNTNSSVPTNPVRTHYTFSGWSPSVPSKFDGNKTFTAQWTPVDYTFTYNLNGGNIGGSTANVNITGKYNTNSSTPTNPTRTHYIFNGWSPSVPSKFDGNKTFTAQWIAIGYEFTFDLNGGNIGGSTANQIISGTYDNNSSTPTNPTRTHYTFSGWSPSVPSKFDGNKTFVAQWTVVNYTITYNLNGGTYGGSTANQTRSVQYNTMPPELTPTRTGQVFLGWTPILDFATKNQIYTAIWSIPMELQMKKASVNEGILIPIEIATGNFALISNNGAEYVKYTTDNPVLTNTVAANTVFTIKVAGRIKGLNYKEMTTAQKNQMYKIIKWGELGATSFENAFYECSKLISPLPAPSANSFVNVTTFQSAFYHCTGLTGTLTSGLFNNCQNVESFRSTFNGCTGLTGIPSGLFSNCSKAESFHLTFYNCSNLTGSIPTALFYNCVEATSFHGTFYSCYKLSGTIPSGLFDSCTKVTTFNITFYNCANITGIPQGLFSNCSSAESFQSTFMNCVKVTAIPTGLFNNCSSALDFTTTFYACTGLTGNIPTGLFDSCVNATTFDGTFSQCANLNGTIPYTLFDKCTKITNFYNTFNGCGKLTGPAPNILGRAGPNVTTTGCFTGCLNLSNYASIPAVWK